MQDIRLPVATHKQFDPRQSSERLSRKELRNRNNVLYTTTTNPFPTPKKFATNFDN